MIEKETDYQVLTENLDVALNKLKWCQPHLNADNLERIALAIYLIRRVRIAAARGERTEPSLAEQLRIKKYQTVSEATLRAMVGGSVALADEADD